MAEGFLEEGCVESIEDGVLCIDMFYVVFSS